MTWNVWLLENCQLVVVGYLVLLWMHVEAIRVAAGFVIMVLTCCDWY